MYRAMIALKMINRRNTLSILKALTKYYFWRLIRRHIFTQLLLTRFRAFRSFFLKVLPNGLCRMLRKEGSKIESSSRTEKEVYRFLVFLKCPTKSIGKKSYASRRGRFCGAKVRSGAYASMRIPNILWGSKKNL